MKTTPTALSMGAMALAGTALVSSCASKQKSEEQTPQKYNIVMIMADDHTQQMISCYDTTYIKTPNIDRIADGGVIFENSFVANSLSGPSRACMFTGKHSNMNGFMNNETSVFNGAQETFPKILQKQGYQTAIIGKWHLQSLPTGFNYWEILPGQGDYYNPDFIEMSGDTVQFKGYVTDIITDKSLAWLDHRDTSKPFCLFVQHKASHRNWLPKLSDLSLYEDHVFPLPSTFYDDYKGRPAAAAQEMNIYKNMDIVYDTKMSFPPHKTRLSALYEKYVGRLSPADRKIYDDYYRPISEKFYKEHLTGKDLAVFKYERFMRDYSKVVYSLDQNVGRVMDYLKAHNLLDNTIVVYTSDQGFYMGEHGWFDKRFMYDTSMRTPLIMHLPKGLDARGAIKTLVQNIDYAPTFIQLAGAKVPADIQGESLVPLLKGDSVLPSGRNSLYYHYYEFPAEHMVKRHYGIRTERYKLIHFYNDIDEWELYDLKKDPYELHNLYNDPQYADIQKDLHKKLDELRVKYHDDKNPE